ncbi:hypothetical protein [Rhodococcus sp. SMB37]|uniref:hypothetical protein n=1 Tax=Rhodococcus sp. SMB37 TaxID=2512213 RepID=UPI00104AF3AB|nr:hypothetical protein [Rhodococcus sp. SMB37]
MVDRGDAGVVGVRECGGRVGEEDGGVAAGHCGQLSSVRRRRGVAVWGSQATDEGSQVIGDVEAHPGRHLEVGDERVAGMPDEHQVHAGVVT